MTPFKFQFGNLTWLGTELSPSEPQNGTAILHSTSFIGLC